MNLQELFKVVGGRFSRQTQRDSFLQYPLEPWNYKFESVTRSLFFNAKRIFRKHISKLEDLHNSYMIYCAILRLNLAQRTGAIVMNIPSMILWRKSVNFFILRVSQRSWYEREAQRVQGLRCNYFSGSHSCIPFSSSAPWRIINEISQQEEI